MLIYLLLILIVMAMSLTVILWAGTLFFQGYIYTEPSPGIFWQAPAAACLLTVGFTIWCLSIALSAAATERNLPIDSIFRFTAKEEMPELQDKPAEHIWAIKVDRKKTGPEKDGEVVAYVRKPGLKPRYQYKDTSSAARPLFLIIRLCSTAHPGRRPPPQ